MTKYCNLRRPGAVFAALCLLFIAVSQAGAAESSYLTSPYESVVLSVLDGIRGEGCFEKLPKREGPLLGGIVPHHDLALEMIARFYGELAAYSGVRRVFLLAPDHFNQARKWAVICPADWKAGQRVLKADRDCVDELSKADIVGTSTEIFKREHGVTLHIPFIARTFPDASVVPILLRQDTPDLALISLRNRLKEVLREGDIIILSMDLSHYKPPEEMEREDRHTLDVLLNLKRSQARTIDVDTPPAAALTLSLLKELEALPGRLLERTDSSSLTGVRMESGTSYATIVYSGSRRADLGLRPNPPGDLSPGPPDCKSNDLKDSLFFQASPEKIKASFQSFDLQSGVWGPSPQRVWAEPKVCSSRIIFLGDVMAHWQQIESAGRADGWDFSRQFRKISPLLEEAFVVANLETVFAGEGEGYSGNPPFNAPDELAAALAEAGVDLLTVANNHIMDRGADGALRTLSVLEGAGMEALGLEVDGDAGGNPLIKEYNGFKLAFFNYLDLDIGEKASGSVRPVPFSEDRLIGDLRRAAAMSADLVVVCFHWGQEYSAQPTDRQRAAAKLALAEGANVVVGTHPHVLQPLEITGTPDNPGVVAYSLGNFISHQRKPPRDRSMLLIIDLERVEGKAVSIRVSTVPILVKTGWRGRYYVEVVPDYVMDETKD